MGRVGDEAVGRIGGEGFVRRVGDAAVGRIGGDGFVGRVGTRLSVESVGATDGADR